MPIIAYLHTSHVLIPMFTQLSSREMPEVEILHLVDESLIKNTIREGRLTKNTIRRVLTMVESAHDGGADAVVVTCSSIGHAASLAREIFDFPVIRVDEAMAEHAVRTGRRIGVAATLKTTLEPTVKLIRDKAAAAGREVSVVESLCAGAFEAVLAGDTATHDRILAESLTRLVENVDVVVLAQASMARIVQSLPPEVTRIPMLSSPELAVRSAHAALCPELETSLV
jgi:Asp/Glu/hydantoin racemase